MIKNSMLIRIKQALNLSKNFSSSDFNIKNEESWLTIEYAYDTEFQLRISVPNKISKLSRKKKELSGLTQIEKDIPYEEYEFSGYMSPGCLAKEERISFEGEDKLMAEISNWLKYLWLEITSQPALRNMQKTEEEIEKIKTKFNAVSEDYFTKKEAEELKTKLDNLEASFKERLEIEINDKELLIETLKDLHTELEKLKSQTKVLNKKNWFTSFGIKIFSWITKEENRNFLKDSKDFIKPLLPDSIKQIF